MDQPSDPARDRGGLTRALISAAALLAACSDRPPAATGFEPRATGLCAAAEHIGGDWPSLNHDLSNSRHQPAEHQIGPEQAPTLVPAWTFSIADHAGTGNIQSTPIVSQGCVYVVSGTGFFGPRGDVFALNADTGQLVWHTTLPGSAVGLAVADGLVYALPSNAEGGNVTHGNQSDFVPVGTYAIALDATTGKRVWTSERLDDGDQNNGTFINASPVAFSAGGRKMLFAPMAGGWGDGARIPMYFLDALTGGTIRKAYSLTEEEYAEGYGGTGIWSTAAFDPETGHLYAGTADSDAFTKQHPYNNAILKIDANPRRSTFGTVVAGYSGVSEHYDLEDVAPVFESNPACTSAGSPLPVHIPTFDSSSSTECVEGDFDFGASPNLFKRPDGTTAVSAMQKAGVFHVVETLGMTADWTRTLGPPGFANNSGTAAVADKTIHVGATPNTVFTLSRSGALTAVSSTGFDAFAYQPLTIANGVVYAIADTGMLVALDAATGAPLLHRPISDDAGHSCNGVGAGVAVARNTVYVPCDDGGLDSFGNEMLRSHAGSLVAYRPR